MITAEEIKDILTKKFLDAQIVVTDLTGTNDHYEVRMMWPGFQGKGLIEQHQMVNRALKDRLEDGSIHALSIRTMV